jgi:hypothetical protein
LLNIICEFSVKDGATYRDLSFKLGWVPDGARLAVTYEETWTDLGAKKVEGTVTFTDKNATVEVPKGRTAPFRVSGYDGSVLKLTVNSPDLPGRSLTRTRQRRTKDGDVITITSPAEGLRAEVTAFIHVDFGGIAKVSVPIGREPMRQKFSS